MVDTVTDALHHRSVSFPSEKTPVGLGSCQERFPVSSMVGSTPPSGHTTELKAYMLHSDILVEHVKS